MFFVLYDVRFTNKVFFMREFKPIGSYAHLLPDVQALL